MPDNVQRCTCTNSELDFDCQVHHGPTPPSVPTAASEEIAIVQSILTVYGVCYWRYRNEGHGIKTAEQMAVGTASVELALTVKELLEAAHKAGLAAGRLDEAMWWAHNATNGHITDKAMKRIKSLRATPAAPEEPRT